MDYKDILVIFTDPKAAPRLIDAAMAVARSKNATLVGLYLIPPITLFSGGLPYSGSVTEIRALEAIEQQTRSTADADAAATERLLRTRADSAGLAVEWRFAEADLGKTAILHARHADLAIVGQRDPRNPAADAPHLVESVVLGCGRPVIVVPYVGHYDVIGRNVLVAWNATREGARAVNDALPLLVEADKVVVMSVNPPDAAAGGPPWPAAEIAHHLARHGVKAEATSTVSHDIDVGNVILSRAADFGSDLLVMGGYGHSRQREQIMGGATRTLLEHMTLPVMFSH